VSQLLKSFAVFCPVFLLSLGVMVSAAHAQKIPHPNQALALEQELDEALSQSASPGSQESGVGSISGTVLDSNGDVLQGAQAKLEDSLRKETRRVDSDNNGHFEFTSLAPGVYKLTVTRPGMNTYTSVQISLSACEVRMLPRVVLGVSGGVTSVTVTGNKEELADEQVHIALQQRIGGVIPNFYSSYDWTAPPMQAKQKFKLSFRSLIDPVSFLTVAGIAGVEQYRNMYPSFGSGIEGYGKRYGAAFANHASATLLCRAVYPSLFHQDPRYFYKGKGSFGSRAWYAVSSAVMTRNDDGRWEPNYSNVLGNFSAAALSNLYYPEADEGASLVLFNGLADTAADAVANLLREFVLKGITSHVPPGANGQP
jgi:hypothetical protein